MLWTLSSTLLKLTADILMKKKAKGAVLIMNYRSMQCIVLWVFVVYFCFGFIIIIYFSCIDADSTSWRQKDFWSFLSRWQCHLDISFKMVLSWLCGIRMYITSIVEKGHWGASECLGRVPQLCDAKPNMT